MKTVVLSTACMCLALFTQAQNVFIPDTKFKAALLADPTVNLNGDQEIQITEALATKKISVYGKQIKDMTGIEAFVQLEEIRCDNNAFTHIDLSKNTALKDFRCGENRSLVALDVSKNKALKKLDFTLTNVKTIDLSQNTQLEYLDCGSTLLTRLDVTENPLLAQLYASYTLFEQLDISRNELLTTLYVRSSSLKTLDITRNPALTTLMALNNPNLPAIYVNSAEEAEKAESNFAFAKDKNTNWVERSEIITGLAATSASDQPLMYPNPAENHVQLSAIHTKLELYDMQGNLVITSQSPTTDVSSLPKGFYQAKLYTNYGLAGITKLIKK